MKKFLGLACLILVGTAGWRIGDTLSSDAISMAVGIFFGVLAGLPTALLLLASDRHKADRATQSRGGMHQQQAGYPAYAGPNQPPVIILNGAGQPMAGQQQQSYGHPMIDVGIETAGWPQQPRPARRFKMVGEEEEWIE